MRQQQDSIETLQAQLTDLLADNAKKSAELRLIYSELDWKMIFNTQELERQTRSRWRK